MTRPRRPAIERLAAVLGVTGSDLIAPMAHKNSTRPGYLSNVGALRVGVWEAPWTIPALLAGWYAQDRFRVASRDPRPTVPTGPEPDAGEFPRRMAPRELLRRLAADEFDCVLVPFEALRAEREHIVECAELARAPGGIHVTVYVSREDPVLRPDGATRPEDPRRQGAGALSLFRALARREPVKIYHPRDVGGSAVVHALERESGCALAPVPVGLENWPRPGGHGLDRLGFPPVPAVVAAPNPYSDDWRLAVLEREPGCVAIPVRAEASSALSAAACVSIRMAFHSERVHAWILRDHVYRFVEQFESEAVDLGRHTIGALEQVAAALAIDVPSLAGEIDGCDFTPRWASAWVVRLRTAAPILSNRRRGLATF